MLGRSKLMEGFVLVMSYLCMASRHTGIEGWYMVHKQVHEHSSMTITWLSAIDSTYLFCYAIGLVISGALEDRFPLRILVPAGLTISGLIYSSIIIMGYSDVYLPYIFLIHFGLQGFFQSTVWPGTVALLGNWFTKTHRGKIMGFWSSNASVGNIIGALVGGIILSFGQDWMVVTMTMAAFQIVVGLVYVLTIPDRPKVSPYAAEQGLIEEDEDKIENGAGPSINSFEMIRNHEPGHKEAMPFLEAIMLPGVIPFSLNFAGVKSLYYGLSMWLPFFLSKRINHPELIGTLAASLNVGAVIGSIVCGWLGDYFKFRPPIIAVFLTVSIPFLILIQIGDESIFWMYFIVIPLTGFFIAGSANIIASAIAADLSENPEVASKAEAMATVAGIIDGAGGFGAALCTFIMGFLSSYDWLYVFLFMVLLDVLSIAAILKISLRDTRKILQNRRKVTDSPEFIKG